MHLSLRQLSEMTDRSRDFIKARLKKHKIEPVVSSKSKCDLYESQFALRAIIRDEKVPLCPHCGKHNFSA